MPIFDRERTILDMFHHFQIFGSMSTALHVLDEHLDDLDLERLASYALRMRVTAIIKRLGWALDMLAAPPSVLEPLRAYPAKEEAPLDPGLASRGAHNGRWQVIENLSARE